LKRHGLNFAYHNHSFEFEKFDGKSGFDIFYETAGDLVKAELDVYWLKHGGEDPVRIINRLGPRVLLLHLKDMSDGPERKFAPVGSGILDFKSILAAAETIGAEWGVVEQDNTYNTPSLDAARLSLNNLRKLGVV
jgi:sugar phosphate isomerase/epimerase